MRMAAGRSTTIPCRGNERIAIVLGQEWNEHDRESIITSTSTSTIDEHEHQPCRCATDNLWKAMAQHSSNLF